MSALASAAIVAIGSELLTPLRVDTNSLVITEALNRLGLPLVGKAVVGDDRQALAHTLRHFLQQADLVVCCGGLGPTDDDVTREAVADVLERPLREDAGIAQRLRERWAARGETMPEINRRQAMVPEGAVVLANDRGTAPGLWIDIGRQVVVLLPGPPREMRPMLDRLAGERLAARATGLSLVRRIVRVTGRTESQTEESMQPCYRTWSGWQPPVWATILASLGQVDLHLSATAPRATDAEAVLAQAVDDVVAVLGSDVYSIDGQALEVELGALLVRRGLRVAVAESCTGGLITSRLTDVPGSSRYVERSIVSYSNLSKTELLGVPERLIRAEGAVSEAVARAMAEGVRRCAGVEIGIGVTGVAGPDGGTPDKPVGTVAIAVALGDDVQVATRRFLGERDMVKFQASQAALDMLRRRLLEM
ncbi:MAG: competence/damage-inducible protein A [Acidobacteria bacterium]|nr:competence/damage-inducible protein A [Acidobacteriota bacterium]